jgi:ATP-dependent RNA helicase RhlE
LILKLFRMGFLPDLIDIFNFIKTLKKEENIQVCLFSATILPGIEGLMKKFAKNYKLINLNKELNVADPIKHIQFKVSLNRKKFQLLTYLMRRKSPIDKDSQILIFVRTINRAERFTELMNAENFSSMALHSDKSTKQRLEIIENFKLKKFRVLFTTEVLSRGIDIPNLKYVINFDIPSVPELYVHRFCLILLNFRIGRCGRMSNEGENEGFAISFVSQSPQIVKVGKRDVEINEVHYMKSIESFLQKRVELRKVPGPWKV